MNKLLGIVVALIILVVILIYVTGGGSKESGHKANIPPPAKYPAPPTLPVEPN
ncbi:hypothetical protein [Cysteiniphilum sp. JM-1]|uniref:hypothetical protein n=1 Tax=Cysteiniphilum sp. JM-1 TaxID=2610891 RepID=UPI00168CEE2D|nr:hypothetical protein [Cysteiniphilum sp. JM-1]